MAKKLVKYYSFTPGVSIDANIAPDAYSLILVNRTFIIKEIVAYIQNKVAAGDSSYVGYVFSTVKCERDSGYVIDALLNDIRYGGNEPFWFKTPIRIDKRGRKFEKVNDTIFNMSMNVLTPSNIKEVAGSKGQIYLVDIDENTCTCPGYTFRGNCKHVKELEPA